MHYLSRFAFRACSCGAHRFERKCACRGDGGSRKGELHRFEFFRPERKPMMEQSDVYGARFRFVNMETGYVYPDFAFNHIYGCCYTEDGKMYVYGTRANNHTESTNTLDVFVSDDLVNWEVHTALTLPEGVLLFNNTVCKGDGKYITAIEIGGGHEMVGTYFTIVFAESYDLINWKLLDGDEYIFGHDHFVACPSIRYYDGYYYMVYVENLPLHRFVPYIVRSKDLKTFEPGTTNPVMFFSDEDKKIICPEKFSAEQIAYIESALNLNNSDLDFCDWNGKTVIMYSWGNQWGCEFLAMAEYNGTEKEFLRSFFE